MKVWLSCVGCIIGLVSFFFVSLFLLIYLFILIYLTTLQVEFRPALVSCTDLQFSVEVSCQFYALVSLIQVCIYFILYGKNIYEIDEVDEQ